VGEIVIWLRKEDIGRSHNVVEIYSLSPDGLTATVGPIENTGLYHVVNINDIEKRSDVYLGTVKDA